MVLQKRHQLWRHQMFTVQQNWKRYISGAPYSVCFSNVSNSVDAFFTYIARLNKISQWLIVVINFAWVGAMLLEWGLVPTTADHCGHISAQRNPEWLLEAKIGKYKLWDKSIFSLIYKNAWVSDEVQWKECTLWAVQCIVLQVISAYLVYLVQINNLVCLLGCWNIIHFHLSCFRVLKCV